MQWMLGVLQVLEGELPTQHPKPGTLGYFRSPVIQCRCRACEDFELFSLLVLLVLLVVVVLLLLVLVGLGVPRCWCWGVFMRLLFPGMHVHGAGAG